MIAVAVVGFLGVIIGALIVTIAFNLRIRYDERKEQKRRALELKVKEIETLNQLNKKINEILQKRSVLMEEYVSFDAFDDCYITIDDYAYLQSFAAQNNFYLPNYILEEFFKKIAQRKVILSPDETIKVGGYAYKGGRVIMEHFSDDLTQLINERKTELKRLSDNTLTYFSA